MTNRGPKFTDGWPDEAAKEWQEPENGAEKGLLSRLLSALGFGGDDE